MIIGILRGAQRLDAWLRWRIGRPYHAILGIGLVIEIARRLHELREGWGSPSGLLLTAATLIFYSILLVHQFGELHRHIDDRMTHHTALGGRRTRGQGR